MASKGNVKGRRNKSKKGVDNVATGQYTVPPRLLPPPPVTTTLQPTTTNIRPLLTCTILLPNVFFMPPLSDQFHTFSSQNSLHSSSSFVPLTSSAPSLSGLRVGGPNTSTSPSMDSATTPSAISVASQNLRFKGVLEYDNVGRLRIIPYRDGFIPQYTDAHMVIEIIKPFFNEPWNSWLEIPYKTRIVMWKQFVCTWSDCHDNEVDRIFWLKAALRIKEHLYEAWNKLVKPSWLNDEVWSKFLILWDTPEYKAKREQGKAKTGGSLHTGGSLPTKEDRNS
ncbi:hypothetical protein P3S68_013691 [Capsicum galapagoense]